MIPISRATAWRLLGPTAAGLAVAFAVAGCDGRPSVESSTNEATVKGKVTVKGKPATKGSVVFDPSNYMRKNEAARKAEIGPDGSYEIKTLVGPNEIRVEGKAIEKASAGYERFALDVPSEGATFDIAIPKP